MTGVDWGFGDPSVWPETIDEMRTIAAGIAEPPPGPRAIGRRAAGFALCDHCGGNGVLNIPGGITECPQCRGFGINP